MPRQKVPDIEFDHFVLGELADHFGKEKIYINPEYQRGDIWRHLQKVELIRSIVNRYSIGVLVLFINDSGKYEILDGQQRLLAIQKYLDGRLDLHGSDIVPYAELETRERILTDAYCIYYLKLKSHDAESKEEDIVQTFLRLQEGTPLNNAEKISAHVGAFKDAFRKQREEHPLFQSLGKEKRFSFRLLAAQLLHIELESDFKRRIFPSLELKSLIATSDKYKNDVPKSKLRFYTGNLDLLHNSLNYFLTALTPREVLSLYMLISYLRKIRAGKENLINEIGAFAKDFHKKLSSFGIYDEKPPKGMSDARFNTYKKYKLQAKVMTTPESLTARFDIVLSEFNRMIPIIERDPERYHDEEKRRILFFRQEGICPVCSRPIIFQKSSAHHMVLHSHGGRTNDLDKSQLLHEKCHQKLEKRRKKSKKC